MPVVAHTYQDLAGHRLLLLLASDPFLQAHGARHQPQAAGADTTLVAEVDGVALSCAEHPAPSLLVGGDQALVLAAAQLLGLRGGGEVGTSMAPRAVTALR